LEGGPRLETIGGGAHESYGSLHNQWPEDALGSHESRGAGPRWCSGVETLPGSPAGALHLGGGKPGFSGGHFWRYCSKLLGVDWRMAVQQIKLRSDSSCVAISALPSPKACDIVFFGLCDCGQSLGKARPLEWVHMRRVFRCCRSCRSWMDFVMHEPKGSTGRGRRGG
jgi:hypothetical protein